MAGTQRLPAIAMAVIFAGAPASGRLDAVGVVVQANHASLGSQSASEGTTVYDGDRLSTDAEGTLRLLIGQAVLHLAERSSAVVRDSGGSGGKQFDAELLSGGAVLSVTPANAGEIVACSARVRPVAQGRGVVRVQIVAQHELMVYAQRGATEISYRGETERIEEGKAYRVRLNAPEDDGGQGGPVATAPGHAGKMIVLIAVGVGVAAAVGLTLALTGKHAAVESPDHP